MTARDATTTPAELIGQDALRRLRGAGYAVVPRRPTAAMCAAPSGTGWRDVESALRAAAGCPAPDRVWEAAYRDMVAVAEGEGEVHPAADLFDGSREPRRG